MDYVGWGLNYSLDRSIKCLNGKWLDRFYRVIRFTTITN